MLHLIEGLPDEVQFHEEILLALREAGDSLDAAQRFHIAACLAMDGQQEARQRMYMHYRPESKFGVQVGLSFVQLDAVPGFLFAAGRIGEAVAGGIDVQDCEWTVNAAKDACGEQEVEDALEASTGRTGINEFRAQVRLQAELAASRAEARRNSELYTSPPDPTGLLSLAASPDDNRACAALEALTRVQDDRVRALAFELRSAPPTRRKFACRLLRNNHRPGDHLQLLHWFATEDNPETLHHFGLDLQQVWTEHPDLTTESEMLQALYDRGPCSFCREFVVSRIIERGELTDEMRLECAEDANSMVRDLAALR